MPSSQLGAEVEPELSKAEAPLEPSQAGGILGSSQAAAELSSSENGSALSTMSLPSPESMSSAGPQSVHVEIPKAHFGASDRIRVAESSARVSAKPPGITESRLLASQSWLAQSGTHAYSIQLMAADDPRQFEPMLKSAKGKIETGQIYIVRTVSNDRPVWKLLYGTFLNRDLARQAFRDLPSRLTTYRPYVRSLQEIRAEVQPSPKFADR